MHALMRPLHIQEATMLHPTILPPTRREDNGDEDRGFGPGGAIRYIGNFHKTMPHDRFGEVDPQAYATFRAAAVDSRTAPVSYDAVPGGTAPPGPAGPAAPFVSPMAGRAFETLGPDPFGLHMWAAPPVRSDATAAEMTELFWMALWRDVSLDLIDQPDAATRQTLNDMLAELRGAFGRGITAPGTPGLHLGLDLPRDAAGALDLRDDTLFRSGFPDEEHGPLVSQFFLHDAPFGTQTISQKQWPYKAGRDYLQSIASWLAAQNLGRDTLGRAYPQANSPAPGDNPYDPAPRYIGSMRDLARFVHKDALHQAYFNAALLLLALDAKTDPGNPMPTARQAGFATLGGPNVLTMVSEVASRALKVVWRQKWMVHRRLRPEAYGGLMTMQAFQGRAYGLPAWVFGTRAAQAIREKNHFATGEDNYLLPMAFSSGSPAHPAYGAGHATVAGACVTMLKAWFDEKQPLKPLIEKAGWPGARPHLLQPKVTTGDLPVYAGADAASMTVGGELNKIASNVAMGRTMGGVHWRSDNTRSLRLGEIIATLILRREMAEYAEPGVRMSYCSFDGHEVTVTPTGISVPTDLPLQAYYAAL
jgi:hypothetical protein